MSASRKLRVGVAGLGMAGGVMIPVIARHPYLQLAGAADPHPLLRQRFERDFQIGAQADIAQLLLRDDIDAVYVATPHQLHALHAEMAARHGKHMVVEKPMALTLDDCDRMIAASAAAAVVLVVGHTHSFDPAIAAIRRLIDGGKLGRPVLLNGFNYTNFMYRPRRPEELDPRYGGGVLWNQMPHQFDSIRLIVGERVRSVRAMTAAIDAARGADGCCAAFIDFAGGAAATLAYRGYDRFDSDEWYGWVGAGGGAKVPSHSAARRALSALLSGAELAERQARWSYGGEALPTTNCAGQPHFGHLIVSCELAEVRLTPSGALLYDDNGVHEVPVDAPGDGPGHRAVWDEFCAAVLDGVKPVHDGAFARGTVELCLAVAESARTWHETMLAA